MYSKNFKPLSGFFMSGVDELSREDLEGMYQEKTILLTDMVAWVSLGQEIEEFPFEKYGLTDDEGGDYLLTVGESQADVSQYLGVKDEEFGQIKEILKEMEVSGELSKVE